MRTMSACCFTEYAKSPGCAMLLSFWIVREELERKKDSGNQGRIVEKRARSLLQARCWTIESAAAWAFRPQKPESLATRLRPAKLRGSGSSSDVRTSRRRSKECKRGCKGRGSLAALRPS